MPLLTPERTVAITANFTAELLEQPLRFWMGELELSCNIAFGPYNQVFQQLLDPASMLAVNKAGMNVVLIRLEEWWRGAEARDESRQQHLKRNATDLVAALRAAAKRSAVPHLLCLCPVSGQIQVDQPVAEVFQQVEKEIADGLRDVPGVYVITTAELDSLYPVVGYEDRRADEVGHVPYTQEFFNALGTMAARRFYRLNAPPYKVIVLDCDHTLWRGVCGEDGACGVQVDAAARALQDFVIAQRSAGMVVCLCSKNNEEDVWKVFEQNAGMVLRRSHIAAWRINWQPKSENIRSLAAELQLGLDSFIFLDDSAMECAEVEARCPEVLALRLPEQAQAASKLLSHLWAFDQLKVTEEDRQRSQLYALNAQREALRNQALSLDDFLAGLELQLDIAPIATTDLARAAQLTQRTNQFNFTTIRRTESEIENLCRDGKVEGAVVKLRDRFGDYGTVGAMLFSKASGMLDVDTVVLSCRALGRRVEHRMLAWLGQSAREHGIGSVRLHFIPTEKNKPAREFLESIGASFESPERAAYSWEFTADFLVDLPSVVPATSSASEAIAQPEETQSGPNQSGKWARILGRIATQINDAKAVSDAIASRHAITRRDVANYIAPRTPFEQSVAAFWIQFLKVDKVSVQDNFFDLGGQSLVAMQIAFRIQEEFQVPFPLEAFLQTPVLVDQARRIEESLIEAADVSDLERLVDEVQKL